MTPLDLVVSRRLDYRLVSDGKEILVKVCPSCGNERWHFYINRFTGKFHCKICNVAGDFQALKRLFGKEPVRLVSSKGKEISYEEVLKWHKRLLKTPKALAYLESRKISVEAVKKLKLGWTEKYGKEVLAIPYLHNGKVEGVKYRQIEQKSYFAEAGYSAKDTLFNADILETEPEEVIITEGELDAACLIAQGYEYAVGLTTGAGQASSGGFLDLLKKAKQIYICFDTDLEGQRATRELAKRLDYQCKCIRLPNGYKDITEYFQAGYSLEDFLSLPKEEIHIENVEPLALAVKNLHEDTETDPLVPQYFSPWKGMNEILRTGKGITEGDLIIVSGVPKSGKTSLLIHWSNFLAKGGVPVLFYCLEMRKRRLIPKFISSYLEKEYTESPEDKLRIINDNPPIYIVDAFGDKSQREVFELIRESVKRYGIKVVVFDNLHFLVSDSSHLSAQVTMLAKQFKLLAEELAIVIFLVAHMTKLENEEETPSSMKLRDSGMIRANADYVFIVHRKRKMIDDPVTGAKVPSYEGPTILSLDNSRYGETGAIALHFYPEIGVFREVGEEEI